MRLAVLVLTILIATHAEYLPSSCKRLLYCNSKLLHYVQMYKIFPDSKTFVDLHLKHDERNILQSFDIFLNETKNKPTKEQIHTFVNINFDTTDDILEWKPKDYNETPDSLNIINDEEFKEFGRNINNNWLTLGRKVKSTVLQNPYISSMVPIPYGFMISNENVQELRYWDSFWIIQGLLVSGMKETAKGIISNLIQMQRIFGHIPKASRWYYQERSQPPLLSAMMAMYLQATKDIEFLRDNINILEDELEYWFDTHRVVMKMDDHEYIFVQYHSPSNGPRPEAYTEDVLSAQVFKTDEDKDEFYVNIKSAGESGWDTAARWINIDDNSNTITSIKITDIIPVDLNAVFANALQNIASFHNVLENRRSASHWAHLAKQWREGIQDILWNEQDGIWYDWNLSNGDHRKHFSLSNISPLWMSVVDTEFTRSKANRILEYIEKSLNHRDNITSSLFQGHFSKWDFSHSCPSFISIVVSALESLQTLDSVRTAFHVAQNWVRSAYNDYPKTDADSKSYYVEVPSKFNDDTGKINIQASDGVFNGVVLEILAKYGPTLKAYADPIDSQESEPTDDPLVSDDLYDAMLLDR